MRYPQVDYLNLPPLILHSLKHNMVVVIYKCVLYELNAIKPHTNVKTYFVDDLWGGEGGLF